MSWTVEIKSSVSADRMFNAAILDWHNLGPKIAPEILLSSTVEGDFRQLNFTSAMPFTYTKEKMDFVDHQLFECESSITEGGHLGTRLESASVKYKIVEATSGEGCIITVVTTTKPLPDIELKDEAAGVIDKAKEAVVKHFKAAEAYLLANPESYYAPAPPAPAESNLPSIITDGDLGASGDGGHQRGSFGLFADAGASGTQWQQYGNRPRWQTGWDYRGGGQFGINY